ncbi:MAG: peptidylprolyl isomerase [Alphaproteobacteria bacterium]|nr:peptidylprolyl isomerase [Alphaproteobacteria bacterium]
MKIQSLSIALLSIFLNLFSSAFCQESTKSEANPKSATQSPSLSNGAKIGVIVNKDVITLQDIYDRAMLILLTAGLPNNAQTLETIKGQVKKSLIDEKIQLAASKMQKILITDAEVQEALKKIAKDNGMTVEQMEEMFKKNNIPVKTLQERLRAQLAWMRTIHDAFGSLIQISEAEVTTELEKIKQNKNKDQYELSEIFFRIENPTQEAAIKKDANKIHGQLNEGAHFHVMAQQFSQATSSSRGGYVGWMVKGQMDPQVEEAVEKLTLGHFSEPIRTQMGYKIILLKDFRKAGQPAYGQTQISFKQVYIPFHDSISEADYNRIETHIQEMSKIGSCSKLEAKAKECGYQCEAVEKMSYSNLPAGFQKLFHTAKIGQCQKPIRMEDHVLVTMVCNKDSPEEKLPTPEEVRQHLEQEKMNKIAAREFNKLKSVAFIDDKTEGDKEEESKLEKKTPSSPKDSAVTAAAAAA